MPTLTRKITDSRGQEITVTKSFVKEQSTPLLPDPIMGVDYSTAASPEPNYYEGKWGFYRAYAEQQARDAWAAATIKPQIIGLTDDQKYPATASPTTVANGLRSFMNTWNSLPARAQTRIVYAWRNEIFNEFTGAIPQNVINVFAALAEVAKEYPNLEIGIDATTYTITSSDAETRWKVIAPYITVLCCSEYPPGRTATPVVFTSYAQFIASVIAMAKDWGIKKFHIWETGSPIDHANQDTGAPNYQGTTDWAKRPSYFSGLLQYTYDLCVANGILFEVAAYWNRQKTVVAGQDHPPNQFKHDRSKAPNDLATVWFNWRPTIVAT